MIMTVITLLVVSKRNQSLTLNYRSDVIDKIMIGGPLPVPDAHYYCGVGCLISISACCFTQRA